MKFRKKLFLSYIIVGIIPILILGIYLYFQERKQLVYETNQNITDSVKQAAENINYKMNIYNNLSYYIAFNPDINSAINQKYTNNYDVHNSIKNIIDPYFETLRSIHKDVETITIYSANSIAQNSSVVTPKDRIKDSYWYKKVINANDTKWFCNDKNLFSVRKLVSGYGELSPNILYMNINYDDVFQELNKIIANEYGVYVLDDSNNVIFAKNKFKDKEKALIPKQIANTKIKNLKENNVKYIVTKYKVSECGWNIYFYKPMKSIYINVNKILFAVIFMVVICCGIVYSFTKLFSYIFVNRIEKLTKEVRLIEMGNLQLNMNTNSEDEIGKLINSFKYMISRINNLIKEVYESKINEREAEMKALQAQINPHFLYNVLSTINWKAIEVGSEDISKVTQELSTFYRTTLNNGKNIISIKDEIANTKSYIEIQSIMHSYSFDVIYNINKELYNYTTIKLILQPIVENAIDHGIDEKRQGRGIIEISGNIVNGCIEFIITDNGTGIDNDMKERLLSQTSKGYGLKNVNDRIKLFYGNDYGISIESELNKYTKVKVIIPIPLSQ
ncbi:sensor histidine kinase [Clostridium oryzae]|nr:histidine kinase [Clostridium oryzae]